MNVHEATLPPVRGLVDRDGRLIEADQRLHDLNARAGGRLGAKVAVPQVATIARLAQRLGILVSRGIVVADGERDIELWVRAEPVDTGVSLGITGWRPRPEWDALATTGDREAHFAGIGADWRWETDAALRLTFLSAEAGPRHGFDGDAMLGAPLTKLFALGEDGGGGFPMLGGLALHEHFDDQPAILRPTGLVENDSMASN